MKLSVTETPNNPEQKSMYWTSTGQWFLNDIQCLSDIRTPAAYDPWN